MMAVFDTFVDLAMALVGEIIGLVRLFLGALFGWL